MATHQRSATDSPYSPDDSNSDSSASDSVPSVEYLDLVGGEYTRRDLSTIIDEP